MNPNDDPKEGVKTQVRPRLCTSHSLQMFCCKKSLIKIKSHQAEDQTPLPALPSFLQQINLFSYFAFAIFRNGLKVKRKPLLEERIRISVSLSLSPRSLSSLCLLSGMCY